jgi:hypothetical protein
MTDSEDPQRNQGVCQSDPADLLLLQIEPTSRAFLKREIPFQMRIKGPEAP